MHVESTYRVNSPYVVHETIDGEVIIVNLDSGSYYSLDQAGADLWESLAQGASLGHAVELLEHRYTAQPGAIANAVQALVAELLAENLLRLGEPAPADGPAPAPNGEARPFVAPVLHKHTDMQDLLLLDPIHEVDEAGWPAVKP
jgi:hypothetical protein